MVDQATEGLDSPAARELEALLAELDPGDHLAFERAAAAVDLAFTSQAGELEPLPQGLAARIAADAARFVGAPEQGGPGVDVPQRELPAQESSTGRVGGRGASPRGASPRGAEPRRSQSSRSTEHRDPSRESARRRTEAAGGPRLATSIGWFAAAAASLALVVVWRDGGERMETIASLTGELDALRIEAEQAAKEAVLARGEAQSIADALEQERKRSSTLLAERDTADDRRQQLLAQLDASVDRETQLEERVSDLESLVYEAPPDVALADLLANPPADLVRVPWSTTGDPLVSERSVGGEVIWSDSMQVGYMVLDDMPVNAADQFQYQLWIFSADQKEETPVDGGVFDASSVGRLVIPIDAKLGVHDPSLFAVTLEKPGGVVVSERDRLLLAAAL
ncbi:hypothetical protein Pla86_06800 [Planctomycetes bacterium Pla86]|uniref:Anti-sigma-K factor rskA n=2 Tax=Engelhardtia mirabilis TaxID=2528011 RepID=A0A518BF72_9BACT|nr:hypothetical protein Pla133_06810 [Planctomycetes bacterium Pla133]QDU99941.1 hypothetical protein Pla86_06800 [Planctomycetes bacterium Pla86]